MSEDKQEYMLTELLMRLVENELNDSEIEYLNNWFLEDEGAAEFYWGFIKDYSAIKFRMEDDNAGADGEVEPINAVQAHQEVIETLSRLECSAPAIDVAEEVQVEEVAEPEKTIDRNVRQSRFIKIYNAIVSVAAVLMVLFIVYANVFPPQYTVEVATMSDAIDVEWGVKSERLAVSSRISTNQPPYVIEKGVAKIVYDNGVDVLIEGPSEFEIERKGIYLKYGKLYSKVSKDGQGFTIDCPNTKFVDLGTEFGVISDREGSSELHVLDGKVQMYAGMEDSEKYAQAVYGGNAVNFDADAGRLEEIGLASNEFVRQIDSSSKFIWRGQGFINLADMVGGGNGFGSGKLERGIYPYTGEFIDNFHWYNSEGTMQEPIYAEVAGSEFIDCVFVPDGSKGPIRVSTEGDMFYGCVDTGGDCWGSIQNGGIHYHEGNIKRHELSLGGIKYGTKENFALFMHASQGVTFDLDKIRESIPGFKIDGFSSLCGVSETVYADEYMSEEQIKGRNALEVEPECTFYVLVDGDVKYMSPKLGPLNEPGSIELEIQDSDRFLTLVTSSEVFVGYQWSLFAMPSLEIKPN